MIQPNPKPAERLIVALDVATTDEALRLIDELDGIVSFYKIGLELLMAGALERLLNELEGRRVFVDLKLPNDIGETIRRTVARSAAMKVDLLTLSGSVTPPTIAAAVEGRGRSASPKLLFVPLLSSEDESDLDAGAMAAGTDFASFLKRRAESALAAGCDGLIASGDAIGLFAQLRPRPLVVSPGIRPSGFPTGDHKRSATPAEAVRMGADYLVVGRPIRSASGREERRRVARAIVAEIEQALAEGSG